MRAVISEIFIDLHDKEKAEQQIRQSEKHLKRFAKKYSERITPALGPHAVYTVSKESLRWCADCSAENDILVNIHLAETRKENEDCIKCSGKRPVPYLEDMGFLSGNLVCAHGVWLTKGEIGTLAKHDVKISHNPVSNMKLAVGGVLAYPEMKDAGLVVSLGTDGCASNNNLDMFESMKFAPLLQKAHRWDQTVMPVKEVFDMATIWGAKALKLDAGVIQEGKLADLVLIDLKRPEMTPAYNLVSDLVYSANGSCVDTLICDGKLLMHDRKVEGEEMILEKAKQVAYELVKRKNA